MAALVLATKLYIPPPSPKVVIRARLLARINTGISGGSKLVLISAPAGFGKTTLAAEWIADSRRRLPGQVAWLSLDEGDSDPMRFLTYFVAALHTALPDIGENILSALTASQSSPPPVESILSALLNEMSTSPNEVTLVLDDYHTLESRTVDNALTFFIEHMPPQVHLMITSREDPALLLSRLRARNQLTELRAADLRFTPAEAAEFLNQMMGLDLSAADVAALESRTEGWIAGLQLAALSIKGHENATEFIQAFAGDNRYIVDYLVEEVLQRQPQSARDFLLQTAILDRLTGSLCDAVTGQTGGRARLDSLQRGNFFLIPLDDKRHWYRYHHLFADVLRMHLMAEQPDQFSALHQRASEWYEQNGSLAEAIHHALAGSDFERAAGLIELAAPAMHKRREEATVLAWMKALPGQLFPARPVLSVLYAGAIMSNGGAEGVEPLLRDAERWLDMLDDKQERPAAMIIVNEEEFRRLPGAIAMYRAGLALVHGDVPKTVTYARQVLDLAPQDDHLGRGGAAALIGLAFWRDGDLEAGYRFFADGMAHMQLAGNVSDAVGGVLALADIRVAQGRLHDAMGIYEQALQLARENGTPTLRGTADMYVGMSELEREHNDLQAATQLLIRSQQQGEHTGFPQNPYRWRVAMARIRETEADLVAALDLLGEAERLYVSDFFPNVRPVAALRARVWLAQGRLDQAAGWARGQGLSAADEVSYLREFEHITLARILLAHHKRDRSESPIREALGLLERLLQAAEEAGRLGSVIEILVLRALAYQLLEDIPTAIMSLERALTLAEPEGYVRMFVDEGANMMQLLREVKVRSILPGYTGKLLAAFQAGQPGTTGQRSLPASHDALPLIEPLSERELEVLRLFRTELSGPEIALELAVSLNTLRTHTKNIYGKLGVNNRRAAIRRAEELSLL
jgi:LuxR family transcriptional regulator, maltose regulon positive regulatory protein